ncbi:M23 family metallopeptidase [Aquibacillus albus]|uniref:Murein DD-endopeptidase MepM/ murein hydrolase activator NlpD n=1 Tax=Aquibacillus albus TaxID=1168171 RepID=A0ABS2N2Z1_9BACI|nr:M23 family metallopeptidase [Aquibacillus albus]MBM7572500.1 murein DD-endopeptidase MepM/ murein hydrolase activator NlpD [Aquibacillus albus]
MSMRKKRCKRWTILVTSDASRRVFQLRIPKFFLLFIVVTILTLSISLYFSHSAWMETKEKNNILNNQLASTKDQLANEQEKNSQYKADAESLDQEFRRLSELEEELASMIASMNPDRIEENTSDGPSGGIEVSSIEEEEIMDRKEHKVLSQHQESLNDTYYRLEQSIPDLIKSFESSIENFSDIKSELNNTPILWPADANRITSEFGNRSDPFTARSALHTGIDIAGPYGTSIYATANGEVVFAGRDGGYGKAVVIEHTPVLDTKFAHLAEITVEEGEQVNKGDIIGHMGSTGRSTGVHLHYEIIKDGTPIDPYSYMTFIDRVLDQSNGQVNDNIDEK